jgi:hypothetical protein
VARNTDFIQWTLKDFEQSDNMVGKINLATTLQNIVSFQKMEARHPFLAPCRAVTLLFEVSLE